MNMNEELIGYLLNALEPDATQAVERHLESSPEARRQLLALRRALHALEADREDGYPPANLVVETLQRIAQYHCRPVEVLKFPALSSEPAIRNRWRRADVLVAASIAFITLMLIPPGMLKLQHNQRVVACAENL